ASFTRTSSNGRRRAIRLVYSSTASATQASSFRPGAMTTSFTRSVDLAGARFRRDVDRHPARVHPQALEVVHLAQRVVEHVDDHGAEVDQHPVALALTLDAERLEAV